MHRYLVLAPAKVNLTLHVLGRRPDGFHDIASLFVPISLADRLAIDVRGRSLALRAPGHPELEGPDNLCLRAARAFGERTGLACGVRVHLDKRIPVAAGLGGGSSDAAAVLRALCRRHGIPAADPRVRQAALEVGSDVPFFLQARPRLARGRGEILEAAPAIPEPLWLVIVKPPFGVSAASAYAALARRRAKGTLRAGKERRLPARLASTAAAARILHNDLEDAVAAEHPIAEVARRLEAAGARATLLAGSGSCVLGLAADAAHARKCAGRLGLRPGEAVFVARTLKQAPGVRDADVHPGRR